MSRNFILLIAAVLLLGAGEFFLLRGNSVEPATEAPAQRQPMTLCLAKEPGSALFYVAREKGYFKDAGLDLTIIEFPSGKQALAAMLASEGQMATTAEVPVVLGCMAQEDIQIVAEVGNTGGGKAIVASRAAGIEKPADLRGKRIGTQKGSAVHFYLSIFLSGIGLDDESVEMSFHTPEDLPAALVNGEIDAMCMSEPFTSAAQEGLGRDAIVFERMGVYFSSECLVTSTAFCQDQPEMVAAMIRALLRAEEFDEKYPTAMATTLAQAFDLSPNAMSAALLGFQFRVSLEQGLLVSLEGESAWALKGDLVPAGRMPNFLDHVYLEGLLSERPERMTIIH